MTRRVAVVGSRDFADQGAVQAFVAGLPPDTVVVSGGARGVDSWAVEQACLCGLPTIVHMADWKKRGRSAGAIRNALIVADCDEVVAFWDGKSRGTMDTVRKARAAGKPVFVIRAREGW